MREHRTTPFTRMCVPLSLDKIVPATIFSLYNLITSRTSSSSFLFLEVFSDVDIWYSCLLKIVTKLKIIEQGKSARKYPQYRHIKANLPDNQWMVYRKEKNNVLICRFGKDARNY